MIEIGAEQKGWEGKKLMKLIINLYEHNFMMYLLNQIQS